MPPREITVRSRGLPDISLAADLFALLFIKIDERNKSKRPALRVVAAQKPIQSAFSTALGAERQV